MCMCGSVAVNVGCCLLPRFAYFTRGSTGHKSLMTFPQLRGWVAENGSIVLVQLFEILDKLGQSTWKVISMQRDSLRWKFQVWHFLIDTWQSYVSWLKVSSRWVFRRFLQLNQIWISIFLFRVRLKISYDYQVWHWYSKTDMQNLICG